jgi:SAM-dependent methyltransferase
MTHDWDPAANAFRNATGRSLEEDNGADQVRYRAYQRDLIRPHCGPSLLEVGSGLGEFAEGFTGFHRHVLTDVDPGAVALLRDRFAGRPEVETRQLDLAAAAAGAVIDDAPAVATALAINVLEHIEDDAGALRAMASVVTPGGTVVIWVPGYQQLYGDFDRAVGHVRRYTPSSLREAFHRAGLQPEEVRPVNLLGGIAWWLTVRRGGVGAPNPRLVAIYDRFVVPCTRVLERAFTPPFGQSILGVARVPRSRAR